MKLTVIKRIAYVVMGGMVTLVLVFNPMVIDFFFPPARLETLTRAIDGTTHLIRHAVPESELVNWYSTVLVPGALYFGKRTIDYLFNEVLPHKEH